MVVTWTILTVSSNFSRPESFDPVELEATLRFNVNQHLTWNNMRVSNSVLRWQIFHFGVN